MQIYFHSRLAHIYQGANISGGHCSNRNVNNVSVSQLFRYFFSPQKKFIMVQNDTREE